MGPVGPVPWFAEPAADALVGEPASKAQFEKRCGSRARNISLRTSKYRATEEYRSDDDPNLPADHPGNGRTTARGAETVSRLQMTVNGAAGRHRCRRVALPVGRAARRPAPDRHEDRLRRSRVRHLHGARQRHAGRQLRLPGVQGTRRARRDHRRPVETATVCIHCSRPSWITVLSSAVFVLPD